MKHHLSNLYEKLRFPRTSWIGIQLFFVIVYGMKCVQAQQGWSFFTSFKTKLCDFDFSVTLKKNEKLKGRVIFDFLWKKQQ